MNFDAQAYLKRGVAERSHHETDEQARITCSFARAERLLGREYHGRFLIELLQNAADARPSTLPVGAADRRRVAVVITDEPALLVANEGEPIPVKVILESLGHIGASTKHQGEAIGHKGIGFKSVLEITSSPEVYSGLRDTTPSLAVKFDPDLALAAITLASPNWTALFERVQGLDCDDVFAAVPILRYPQWVDDIPTTVRELGAAGYDTVVRLPFDVRFQDRLGLDKDAWLKKVRLALPGVSDKIVLLLRCFSEVTVEDRIADTRHVITTDWTANEIATAPGVTSQTVTILRNGQRSTCWHFVHRALADGGKLSDEIAVGIPLADGERGMAVVANPDGEASWPFHLFFPTRIPSGLPFLLHGYFEVDAARTAFYRGSESRNRAIIESLADLTASALRDLVDAGRIDLLSLAERLAAAGDPEEQLARVLREGVLARLDDISWVPISTFPGGGGGSRPVDLLLAPPGVAKGIARTFPAGYIAARVGLGLPIAALSVAALRLVTSRYPRGTLEFWEALAKLARPGDVPIWPTENEMKSGFLALLDLLPALETEDRTKATAWMNALEGDDDARLLPTVGECGALAFLPIPAPGDGAPGRRSRLVMARIRETAGEPLVPPAVLDVAFLPDRLLSDEGSVERAKPLGVRPFTVDNVLDRFNGALGAVDGHHSLLRFTWQFLHREQSSPFGTKRCAERALRFAPETWFWCQPGRSRIDDNERLKQQRERYLAQVAVPCRDGTWRPAGTVAFGADWAEWLEKRANAATSAHAQRLSAYRALETLAPGPWALLAAPETVIALLPPLAEQPDDDSEHGAEHKTGRLDAERHAFLLRLGVWEVPPIEAYESRDPRERDRFPWGGSHVATQAGLIEASAFGLEDWLGTRHNNTYLAEDYRFAWPLEDMARRDARLLANALQNGAALYTARCKAVVFCPQCKDAGSWHKSPRYNDSSGDYPSILALELRQDRWALGTLDGEMLEAQAPSSLWWHRQPPTGAGLRSSPYRLLPLCSPATGMTEALRALGGVSTMEDASAERIRGLLSELRANHEAATNDTIGAHEGSRRWSLRARQAFVSLHRLAYEQLAAATDTHRASTSAAISEVGILCEVGERLEYRKPAVARHDTGQSSAYARHFAGEIAFAALARDQSAVAKALGVPAFDVQVTRRGTDAGLDVTEKTREFVADRVGELLAIVVHHSLGSQTLSATSQDFETRARRLTSLEVRQLADLVVDAAVIGTDARVTIGVGTDQDIFVEGGTTATPVLFHDLAGSNWPDKLRRRIAPHLASLVENPAYAATFELFLQKETEAYREEFLLDLGISRHDVDAIRQQIGLQDEDERARHRRWFSAVVAVRGASLAVVSVDHDALVNVLVAARFDRQVAVRLVELGGGEDVRSNTTDGAALRLLHKEGVDLAKLHASLLELHEDGLKIRDAERAFKSWRDGNERRFAASIATRMTAERAKDVARRLQCPIELQFTIDPPLSDVIAPFIAEMRGAGLEVDAESLAESPAPELARVAGFASVELLDRQVHVLYSEEEQRRVLRERAAQWRCELTVFAVLARVGPAALASTVRSAYEAARDVLPASADRPSAFVGLLGLLFGRHGKFAERVEAQLVDSVSASVPSRDALCALANEYGFDCTRLSEVERVLFAPRGEQARDTRRRAKELEGRGLAPCVPAGFLPAPAVTPATQADRKHVATIKVGESHDRRKRQLGDEGEKWALAAVVSGILGVGRDERVRAIGEIIALLETFVGKVVDEARSHGAAAVAAADDDEALVEELSGLLHLSRHSDGFGCDMIGWLAPAPDSPPKAICLEVKSGDGEGFHISSSEWLLAKLFHKRGDGDRYAILVVRRDASGRVPKGMDLLVDPVRLVDVTRELASEADGYVISYRKAISSPDGDRRGGVAAEESHPS